MRKNRHTMCLLSDVSRKTVLRVGTLSLSLQVILILWPKPIRPSRKAASWASLLLLFPSVAQLGCTSRGKVTTQEVPLPRSLALKWHTSAGLTLVKRWCYSQLLEGRREWNGRERDATGHNLTVLSDWWVRWQRHVNHAQRGSHHSSNGVIFPHSGSLKLSSCLFM